MRTEPCLLLWIMLWSTRLLWQQASGAIQTDRQQCVGDTVPAVPYSGVCVCVRFMWGGVHERARPNWDCSAQQHMHYLVTATVQST